MSRITSAEKREMERNTTQGEVPATYSIFEKNGAKYFQIDTYGSSDRECAWKPSQTIQFDRRFANELSLSQNPKIK